MAEVPLTDTAQEHGLSAIPVAFSTINARFNGNTNGPEIGL